ncbi:hypothetical protein ACFPTR_12445 [Aliibacillus thermotolerans]|uniref:Uncharacterized protein n=1 Tax=Aliibacillus thermotolerans TaxID=1834418 RepID=A0ABW0U849_9BACI|nr:hypothetical protein [Aliibacillus thermotolerans]MDA3129645.1 hypothetical protein [Aliibacillus thermotolerans]
MRRTVLFTIRVHTKLSDEILMKRTYNQRRAFGGSFVLLAVNLTARNNHPIIEEGKKRYKNGSKH